ncbi:hypothetical protein RSAG8_12815, partial [Rhizoctonia solani AG-8 WAC10335]
MSEPDLDKSDSCPGYGVYRIYYSLKKHKDLHTRLALDSSGSLVSTMETAPDNSDKWIFYPVSASPEGLIAFRVTSFDGHYILSYNMYGKAPGLGVAKASSSYTTWNVEPGTKEENFEPRVWTNSDNEENTDYHVQSEPGGSYSNLTVKSTSTTRPLSGWTLERLSDSPPAALSWSGSKARGARSFQDKLFHLTPKEAAWEEYDYIIVGSGIGGGVLANDLRDTNFKLGKKAQRILLLEKGVMVFHTHCLNTARPAGLLNDRGQQNDTFFKDFREYYTFQKESQAKPEHWDGGPMYNLGGRSAAWGLFAPRVDKEVLDERFPKRVAEDLTNEYYDKAERLMLVSLPTTHRAHQHIMDRLNLECRVAAETSNVHWHWGRIASEFRDDRNFDFAEGAYSTIDKILEIAMSRPKTIDAQGKEVLIDHKHFKTVLNAGVRSLEFDSPTVGSTCTGVKVQDPSSPNDSVTINLRKGGKVLLCAGSVNSPAILLRSKALEGVKWADYNGLHLTDHNIIYFQCPFYFRDPAKRAEYGAMKLQTYVKLCNTIVLVNISIDASSFLPRGNSPDENLPKFIMVFMHQEELIANNTLSLGANQEPRIDNMERNHPSKEAKTAMKKFTVATMKALAGSANLEFLGFEQVGKVDFSQKQPATDYTNKVELGCLPLGGVAHELGTLPMPGVYVCDLSCFPYSPAANPTLTLAALAIRLSRRLVPRLTERAKPNDAELKDWIRVVNHSGSKVRVFLTHRTADGTDKHGDAEPMEAGESKSWRRPVEVFQGLFVYKLDRSNKDKKVEKFLERPIFLEARPGPDELTTILSN